jgi:hypothetical protein
MRKLLLSTAAAIILAGPALAGTKFLSATLSGPISVPPKGRIGQSTIVNGLGVNFIALGNRVVAYDPTTQTVICTVTVPLSTITDMAFTPPPANFLTVQGAGPFVVTISYGPGCPNAIFPPVGPL